MRLKIQLYITVCTYKTRVQIFAQRKAAEASLSREAYVRIPWTRYAARTAPHRADVGATHVEAQHRDRNGAGATSKTGQHGHATRGHPAANAQRVLNLVRAY